MEHLFETTLEPHGSMQRAAELLLRHGFEPPPGVAFQVDGTEWTVLEVRRGKRVAHQARTLMEAPLTVRLEQEGRRVVVAAVVDTRCPPVFGQLRPEARPDSRRGKPYVELLTVIARSLERRLGDQASDEEADAEWAALDRRLEEALRADRRWARVKTCIAIAFLAITLALFVRSSADLWRRLLGL